jgi:serpin B
VTPPAGSDLAAADLAAAQTAFGVDLLRAVAGPSGGRPVLLSPTSAVLALGMLYPAAAGSTAQRLGALLHLPPWDDRLAAAAGAHTRALAALVPDGDPDADGAPDALSSSNRLWAAGWLQPDPGYLAAVVRAFAAAPEFLDIAGDPAGATRRVDDAVAADTRGRVPRLLDGPLRPDTAVVLTNALHLRARWAVPFTGTAPAPFAAPSGQVTVPMMSGAHGSCRRAGGWRSVELRYRSGTLSAVVVLPPEGTSPTAVDAGALAALATAEPAEFDVRLPRLRIEQTHDLLGPLAALGLPVRGDYRRLGSDRLTVDAVVQRTVLDVDELGTEAAAATAVVVRMVAWTAPRPEVVVDRPFLLLLTDTATRSPLFLAVVTDPRI